MLLCTYKGQERALWYLLSPSRFQGLNSTQQPCATIHGPIIKFFEIMFCYIAKIGLQVLGSTDPVALQIAETTGNCHPTECILYIFFLTFSGGAHTHRPSMSVEEPGD